MTGILYLEDGSIFYGESFGKEGTTVAELVFNTAMTGYQEILTDPSYAGQIVNMTYPLIGNYGIDYRVSENDKVHLKGFIVKKLCNKSSNYTSEEELKDFLKKHNVIAISNIDTRKLTKKIREKASLKCVMTTENLTTREFEKLINNYSGEKNLVEMVSRKETTHIKGDGHKLAILDFGIKNNIIKNFIKRGFDITIFPYNASYQEIMAINPQGIFLSNGPGDPRDIPGTMKVVKRLVEEKPVFGICLGHQLLSLVFGGKTYKLTYGHHGGNHGVYDKEKDICYITAQNHEYAVDETSLKNTELVVTHVNLNDNTIEGMRHKTLPVFSVQFHPEGAPGPDDSEYVFDDFIKLIDKFEENRVLV